MMMRMLDFITINAPLTYNTILDKPAINAFKMISFYLNLFLKFTTLDGVITIRRDDNRKKDVIKF